MNILYIDHYAGSKKHGRSFRPYYLGKEWIKKGHKLTVVAGTFSHLRNLQPKKAGVEVIEGITYIWLKTPKYKGNDVKRFWSMIVFAAKLFTHMRLILKTSKPDVIVASSVYMLDMFPAWLMKKITKTQKLVFELHDLWPLSPMEIGGMSKWHPFIVIMRIAEWWAYLVADTVVSILPGTFSYMQKFGISKKQFFYVPNGIDFEDWSEPELLSSELTNLIKDLKNKGKFLVGYAGSHALSNALSYLIDAAKIIQDKDDRIHFIMVGDGQEKHNLVELAKSNKLHNVSFINRITKRSIPNFTQKMDVLYLGWLDKTVYKYGLGANKLFDYMMATKPILHSTNVTDDLVRETKCGIAVPAENSTEIANAISNMIKLAPEKLNQLGRNGHNYVIDHHNYKQLTERFLIALGINE